MARMAHTNIGWDLVRVMEDRRGPRSRTEPAFTCVHFSIKCLLWRVQKWMRDYKCVCVCEYTWAPTPIVVVVQSSLFMLELSGVRFAHWVIRSVFLFHSFRSPFLLCNVALPSLTKERTRIGKSELNVGTFIANSMGTDERMEERTNERKKEIYTSMHTFSQSFSHTAHSHNSLKHVIIILAFVFHLCISAATIRVWRSQPVQYVFHVYIYRNI